MPFHGPTNCLSLRKITDMDMIFKGVDFRGKVAGDLLPVAVIVEAKVESHGQKICQGPRLTACCNNGRHGAKALSLM